MTIKSLFDYVVKYPTFDWNWNELTINPNITPKNILTTLHLPWNISHLSENPSVVIQDVLDNPNIEWDFEQLASCANITLRDVQQYPEFGWDIESLSCNINITAKDVIDNPNLGWSFYDLFENPNIQFRDIKIISDIVYDYDYWDSEHAIIGNITIEDALDNEFCHFNWKDVSASEYITMQNIQDNKKFPVRNSTIPWDYNGIERNPNITIKYMEYVSRPYNQHPHYWNMNNISQNPGILIQDVLDNLLVYKWNFSKLSRNPSITFRDIMNHPELPWNWDMISVNPTVTISDILYTPEKDWNYCNLSSNQFCYHPFFRSCLHKKRLTASIFGKI